MGQHSTRHTSQAPCLLLLSLAHCRWMELHLDYHFSKFHVFIKWAFPETQILLQEAWNATQKSISKKLQGLCCFRWPGPLWVEMTSTRAREWFLLDRAVDSLPTCRLFCALWPNAQPHITRYTRHVLDTSCPPTRLSLRLVGVFCTCPSHSGLLVSKVAVKLFYIFIFWHIHRQNFHAYIPHYLLFGIRERYFSVKKKPTKQNNPPYVSWLPPLSTSSKTHSSNYLLLLISLLLIPNS